MSTWILESFLGNSKWYRELQRKQEVIVKWSTYTTVIKWPNSEQQHYLEVQLFIYSGVRWILEDSSTEFESSLSLSLMAAGLDPSWFKSVQLRRPQWSYTELHQQSTWPCVSLRTQFSAAQVASHMLTWIGISSAHSAFLFSYIPKYSYQVNSSFASSVFSRGNFLHLRL